MPNLANPGAERPQALVEPDDTHNRRLVALVHPPDWPESSAIQPRFTGDRYNLVVAD